MDVYTTRLRSGITRSKEFERKRLACFAVDVGTKCGHGCSYCSTGAVLRMNRSFKEIGRPRREGGGGDRPVPEAPARSAAYPGRETLPVAGGRARPLTGAERQSPAAAAGNHLTRSNGRFQGGRRNGHALINPALTNSYGNPRPAWFSVDSTGGTLVHYKVTVPFRGRPVSGGDYGHACIAPHRFLPEGIAVVRSILLRSRTGGACPVDG